LGATRYCLPPVLITAYMASAPLAKLCSKIPSGRAAPPHLDPRESAERQARLAERGGTIARSARLSTECAPARAPAQMALALALAARRGLRDAPRLAREGPLA